MAKVYQDLRSFLSTLEENGQLVRIKEEVNPEPDIAAAGRAAANIESGPAVLFEKVKGYPYSVVTNVHGSWANHALMLGMDKTATTKEQFHEINRRWDRFPVKPEILKREKKHPVKKIPLIKRRISTCLNSFHYTESMIRMEDSFFPKHPLLRLIPMNG